LRLNESIWFTEVVRIKTNFTSPDYEIQKAVSSVIPTVNYISTFQKNRCNSSMGRCRPCL